MHVAEEQERKAVPPMEFRLREGAVTADREDDGLAFSEVSGDPAEVAQLRCSDTAPVVAVEEQHDPGLALEVRERDGAAARRRQGERRRRVAVADHGVFTDARRPSRYSRSGGSSAPRPPARTPSSSPRCDLPREPRAARTCTGARWSRRRSRS